MIAFPYKTLRNSIAGTRSRTPNRLLVSFRSLDFDLEKQRRMRNFDRYYCLRREKGEASRATVANSRSESREVWDCELPIRGMTWSGDDVFVSRFQSWAFFHKKFRGGVGIPQHLSE